ncbi:MAG: hypothetical protein FJX59_03380 [Alphaproteobacteria bacterium]|nr:hypothetical protein [Alphaproteobacteria bacterium]
MDRFCLTRWAAGLVAGVAAAAISFAVVAQEPEPTDSEPNEQSTRADPAGQLPVPRFVSLRTNPVNLRIGPGVRYQIEWVYVRKGLPVEVIAEYETWRRIRDSDGAEGWVHQSMLSGRRSAVVNKDAGNVPLRKTELELAEVIATLEPGVTVTLQRCPAGSASCRVEVAGHQGWLARAALWGLYPTEALD